MNSQKRGRTDAGSTTANANNQQQEVDPLQKQFANFLDRTAKVPPLPCPLLFWSIRRNLQDVRDAYRRSTATTSVDTPLWWSRVPNDPLRPPPCAMDLNDAIQDGWLLDVRSFSAYTKRHVRGSINIPMTFPCEAFGAKKAELWLLCLVATLDVRIVVLCSDEPKEQPLAVQRRLEELGLTCVTVMAESAFPWEHCSVSVQANPTTDFKKVPVQTVSSRVPSTTTPTMEIAALPVWRRVGASHESLSVLDRDPHTLVLTSARTMNTATDPTATVCITH